MKSHPSAQKTASVLRALGQPTRVRIMLAIGEGEACVCHLEASLKQRQAYISQHLMALRRAGLLDTRRDGRFIFYRLREPETLNLLRSAGHVAGVSTAELAAQTPAISECGCPNCASTRPGRLIPLESVPS